MHTKWCGKWFAMKSLQTVWIGCTSMHHPPKCLYVNRNPHIFSVERVKVVPKSVDFYSIYPRIHPRTCIKFLTHSCYYLSTRNRAIYYGIYREDGGRGRSMMMYSFVPMRCSENPMRARCTWKATTRKWWINICPRNLLFCHWLIVETWKSKRNENAWKIESKYIKVKIVIVNLIGKTNTKRCLLIQK